MNCCGIYRGFLLLSMSNKVWRNYKIKTIQMGTNLDVISIPVADTCDVTARLCRYRHLHSTERASHSRLVLVNLENRRSVTKIEHSKYHSSSVFPKWRYSGSQHEVGNPQRRDDNHYVSAVYVLQVRSSLGAPPLWAAPPLCPLLHMATGFGWMTEEALLVPSLHCRWWDERG